MNTTELAVSLDQCMADEAATLGYMNPLSPWHGLVMNALNTMKANPEWTCTVLKAWKAANPGLDITMNGTSIVWP